MKVQTENGEALLDPNPGTRQTYFPGFGGIALAFRIPVVLVPRDPHSERAAFYQDAGNNYYV